MNFRFIRHILLFLLVTSTYTRNCRAEDFYWNSVRGYSPFRSESDGKLIVKSDSEDTVPDSTTLPYPAASLQLAFRCANIHNIPYKSYSYTTADGKTAKTKAPGWKLVLTGEDRQIVLHINPKEVNDAFSSSQAIEITAESSGETISRSTITKGLDLNNGENSFKLAMENGAIMLRAGNREYQDIMKIELPGFRLTSFGFLPDPGGKLSISDISLHLPGNESFLYSGHHEDIDSIIMRSTDPLVGFWSIFDRNFEESLLRMGGDYELAIIPDGEEYTIIYLSGASKNSRLWKKGMVKGRLSPSPFENIFATEWIDSNHSPITHEIKAQLENDILTINFPYQNSSLRLRKIRRKQVAGY